MKIDTDLRLAIKSAEKAQPCNGGWEERDRREQAAISEFMKRLPLKAKIINSITKGANDAYAKYTALSKRLCAEFGLKQEGNRLKFASCGEGATAFKKAGGKIEPGRERWTFDAVMKELAGADAKAGKAILKKYGIVWE